MLVLESSISLNAETIKSPNLCGQFSENDLKNIGRECFVGYDADERSREQWLRRNEVGMDLALQIQKDKNFPWPGCSNVAFPLVTIAAMQFHARAYPAIVSGNDIVKCAVFGDDPTGTLTAHANRVSTHMSWQLLYEDKCWEEQEDKAILNLSIVGTNFKKSYRKDGHNVSELVLAKDLVLNYWAKSVEECPRKTHRIPKFRNEVYENVMRGIWRDVLEESWYCSPAAPKTSTAKLEQDKRQGVTPPQPDDTTSLLFLEQHCNLDLDADGYAEPYIITFEATSQSVVRIVTNFDSEDAVERVKGGPRNGQIVKITENQYFTKKTFIPSPDGGIYDIGFGVFLGPLNESVNSLVNMLLDAGTLQTTAGGFLGRGAKIRSGTNAFSPFEWKRVDATGDDLRKSVFPLPANAPSDVLFQLLSLLIDYASRIAGTTDITVGENPGQNTPAQTTQTMVEMGQKIYTAIFKRLWRSSREEFQKLFRLNGKFMLTGVPSVAGATRADYMIPATNIQPVADPNITSDSQRIQQAMLLKQTAATTPGYDMDAVERRFLSALRVEGIDTVFKGANDQPPPKDPLLVVQEAKNAGALQVKQLDAQTKQAELQLKGQQLQTDLQKFAVEMQEEQRTNNATILSLEAQAQMNSAKAEVEKDYAQAAVINAQIAMLKHHNDELNAQIDNTLRAIEIQSRHFIETKKLSKETAA